MTTLLHDLRTALRTFRKRPAFTLMVVAILGIGLGAATAVFDIVNVLSWRQLPVDHPERLLRVFTAMDRGFVGPYYASSYADYADYREAAQSFSGLAAHHDLELRLDTGDNTEILDATAVSGNFFDVLGLQVTQGRPLTADDDQPGQPPVMVLGHRLWQRLGAAPDVAGSTMKIEGTSFTVVGVGPHDYSGSFAGVRTDFFLPAAALARLGGGERAVDPEDRDARRFYVIGRLEPGISVSRAEAELATIASRLDADHPLPSEKPRHLTVTPATVAHPVDLERVKPSLRLFAVAVALLLVITCANVAHLLLARSTARQREMGIRQSIGADRWRLVRQLLTENLLLALAGGLCGLFVAYWSRGFLSTFYGPEFAAEMRLDSQVFGASFLTCLAATLLFGLMPAWTTSRVNLVTALKAGPEGSGSHRFSTGRLLAGAQVALCVVLMAAGLLLTRSLWLRLDADLGFDDKRLFITNLALPASDYPTWEDQVFFERLRERAESLPGVERAGLSYLVPPILFDLSLPIRLPEAPDQTWSPRFNAVDGHYFETMGIRLESGRLFDARDAESGQPVVIVSRKLADQLWPGEDPLGRTILSRPRTPDQPEEKTVIGVVHSVAQHRSGYGGEPVLYFSAEQRRGSRQYLILRTTADATAISESLRGLLREMDPELAPLDLRTGEENRRQAFAFEEMQAIAVGTFAVLGLALAILGIFGVLSYSVSCRIREVGIRMALGARRQDIVRQIVGQGLTVTLVGVGVGLAATFVASRWLASLLFGVTPGDVTVLGTVVAVVTAAALTAAYLPARRASRLDPLDALRQD